MPHVPFLLRGRRVTGGRFETRYTPGGGERASGFGDAAGGRRPGAEGQGRNAALIAATVCIRGETLLTVTHYRMIHGVALKAFRPGGS